MDHRYYQFTVEFCVGRCARYLCICYLWYLCIWRTPQIQFVDVTEMTTIIVPIS